MRKGTIFRCFHFKKRRYTFGPLECTSSARQLGSKAKSGPGSRHWPHLRSPAKIARVELGVSLKILRSPLSMLCSQASLPPPSAGSSLKSAIQQQVRTSNATMFLHHLAPHKGHLGNRKAPHSTDHYGIKINERILWLFQVRRKQIRAVP
jgi:hypothetical protein